MDPERVRAYLQVACAGLGFDIGEVWWTSNESGNSTVAAIEEKKEGGRHLRFVQLYTSKSYEDRRSMLVSPEEQVEEEEDSDLKKHVLSPQLVNAISSSAKVLWTNSHEQEGLLGKSDVRLQTAVGMPVAVDGNGNMCVVVMFSPNQIQNTDDAMDYLQSISQSATSTSIPCLMPVFSNMQAVLPDQRQQRLLTNTPANASMATINESDLSHAPKDSFGIPKLPAFAELGGSSQPSSNGTDAFDDASYGVWNTIMEATAPNTQIVSLEESRIPPQLQERMEEFITAFLNMSVFDAADIWSPKESGLSHCVTILAADSVELEEFRSASEGIFIRNWSGAVGRAYASGNPVWSHVADVTFDQERKKALEKAGIQTILAVPVSNCVLCCYSMVRTDPVPFVLKFLQQALRLLWTGLDNVEKPQVEQEIWKDVGPADLGEMAADLEMQNEFLRKKRPRETMERGRSESLSLQMDSLATASEDNVPLSSNSQFSIEPYQEEQTTQSPPAKNDLQNHLQNAVLAVGEAVPWAATNAEGTKRAHVMIEELPNNTTAAPNNSYLMPSHSFAPMGYQQDGNQVQQYTYMNQHATTTAAANGGMVAPAPMVPSYAPSSTIQPAMAQAFQTNITNQGGYHVPMNNNLQPQTMNTGMQSQAMSSTMQAQAMNNTMQAQPMSQTLSQPVAGQFHSAVQQASGAPLSHPMPLQMPSQFPSQIIQPPALNLSGGMAHVNHVTASAPSPLQQQQQYQPSHFDTSTQYQQTGENMLFSQPMYSSQPMQPLQSSEISSRQIGLSAPAPSHFCQPAAPAQPVTSPTSNAGGKPCRIQGCDDPVVARRPYCVKHSGNRLCEHTGCTKCAQGSTRFCIAHGGGRRCTFAGCDKGARDKYFCAAHGGGKRCTAPNCTKSAVGGSNLCTGHGGGRRCGIDGCNKSAQSSTKLCVKHGGGKKCTHVGCVKVARGRTPFCAAHGGGIRCKLNGCNRVAIGKLQLCRSHGGGIKQKGNENPMLSMNSLSGQI